MEKPFKWFTAVIAAALAAAVAATGCRIQKGTDAAVNASDNLLLSSGASSLNVGSVNDGNPTRQKGKSSSVSSSKKDAVYKKDPVSLNDAVFIGDSVTLKLQKYVTAIRKKNKSFLGKARFLAAGSMGSGNALKPLGKNSIHPYYNGKKALIGDSIAEMHAEKAFIMLGMNDIAIYGIDGSVKNLERLTKRIISKNLGITIYIQSVTPILKSKQKRTLNNDNIKIYNNKLKDLCKLNGWNYMDVASAMCSSDGSLKPEYCSDPDDLGIHFTDKACNIWIHYLLTHIKAG